jgi:peroxiredoxin
MLPLGSPLPSFTLPDAASGRSVRSAELAGNPAVVIFICNHCPFVKHIREELARFGTECRQRGVGFVAISSNDASAYPEDSPEAMAREAREHGYAFPYLFDESQDVARAFQAACTPDLYIFDASGRLAYRGQFDASRPGNGVPVTGRDARAAVEALLTGARPSAEQVPSIGCNIKWKPSTAAGP